MEAHPCVLVVEDETNAREVIVDSLEAAGCKAVSAADGQEAIQVLARTSKPCVILLDLMMPRMNGWQFRDWLKQQDALKSVPVVLLSAVRDLGDEARRLDAAGYLEKPLTFPKLLDTVQRFCGPCEEDAK
jgi:CheY-like chemotaxis protein